MKYLLFFVALFFMKTAKAQNRYDIVIDEIMADPSPTVGLPNNEWIELKNTSAFPVNLQNWRIADANGQSGPMPFFFLQPDSFVIVCSNTASAALSVFGTTISVSTFPSFDNDGDQLSLKAATGSIIHAISYSLSWYQNELKKEGGWTLEMIDTKNPCTGPDNWKASTGIKGGTPGTINSLDVVNTDATAPQVKNVYTLDSITIVIVYNEPVDSTSGAAFTNYSIENGLTITGITTLPPLFDKVQLTVNTAFQPGTIYTFTVTGVTDCKGNAIGSTDKAKVGLPVDASVHELVINEILFNPRPNGYDYIELYNNSNKIFDASRLYIANRNSNGAISSVRVLSSTPYYIFPEDYIVITEDASRVALQYLVRHLNHVLMISSLPSFPNDEGDVILLNFQGEPIDEIPYKDDWHFSLLDNTEGIALERIDPSGPSQQPSNWHSAASTAGYGTPTYKNSQYRAPQGITATIVITPPVFSPDNDGVDDIALIQYKIDEPGYVANIIIFDAAGRPVKTLVKNETMSSAGYWNWNGLNDKNQSLPVGIYIIFTEIFNVQGKKQRFKNTVVLTRRLK